MNKDNSKASFDVTKYPTLKKIDKDGVEREYYIIPDDLFLENLQLLPDGTYNESRNKRKYGYGCIGVFGADPEADREIQKKGAETLNAAKAQRRTFKEQADILLARVDKENGKSGIENITIAMMERALAGDVKAYTALRDTAGEKPAEALDLNANVMTEADQALIEKLKSRMLD